MKREFSLLAVTAVLFTACAVQTKSQVSNSLKFDFGTEKAAKGYTAVTPGTIYSAEKGYGFDLGTGPESVDRGGNDLLKSDFVKSDKPFYFSVKVPEGNYKVTLTLGDSQGKTATTVKSESRRLMLENAQTETGKFRTETFIVHVKDRNINGTSQVSLKPRELTKLDWDDKLTLEFDLQTAVNAVEIEKVDDQITVFLAGNSTVVNQDDEPWASWGQMIPRFFKPGVAISNHAESGLSLGSFIGSKRLAKILSIMKPGDYLFVEFGHNDEKEKGPNDGPYKSYSERLRTFATEVKSKGGHLVIVTPTARRSFGQDGKMNNTHGDYPDAAKKVAQEVNVPLIDLTSLTTRLFETLGPENSKKAFVIYPELNLNDNTHFNTYGAYEIAKIIASAIKDKKLGISKFVVDMPAFDPARPDSFETFNWPASPKASIVKPDGN
ncbi:rhamnogalacturonan acetylesterase [Pedobacter sp. P351]|uniref:rhamnogalacturonan acetylesterase n=1 Tax=Pedobacter superstes TaxID=3133441 RepID=UPI0030AAC998